MTPSCSAICRRLVPSKPCSVKRSRATSRMRWRVSRARVVGVGPSASAEAASGAVRGRRLGDRSRSGACSWSLVAVSWASAVVSVCVIDVSIRPILLDDR